MKTYQIATIPGDGIGKEVIPAGVEVLQALAAATPGLQFNFHPFEWGSDWYRAHGEMMPADGLDQLRDMDAILFGSAGDPQIADHVTLWGLRLKICQGFGADRVGQALAHDVESRAVDRLEQQVARRDDATAIGGLG